MFRVLPLFSKKETIGWTKLFKIQSHSLGHALRTQKVHRAVEPHNQGGCLFIAYLACETPIERYAVYRDLDVPELE
jgi:hypothetical protein